MGKGVGEIRKKRFLPKLYGANKRYLDETIPHVTYINQVSFFEVMDKFDLVIISKKTKQ